MGCFFSPQALGQKNNKMEETNKGCGKRLPVRKRKVRDSLVCSEFQLCDNCSQSHGGKKNGKD